MSASPANTCGRRCCFLPYASSTKPTLLTMSETNSDEVSNDTAESQEAIKSKSREVQKHRPTYRLRDLPTLRLSGLYFPPPPAFFFDSARMYCSTRSL